MAGRYLFPPQVPMLLHTCTPHTHNAIDRPTHTQTNTQTQFYEDAFNTEAVIEWEKRLAEELTPDWPERWGC